MKRILNLPKFICKNYRRFLTLLYMPLYMSFFTYVESRESSGFHLISGNLDQYIPFCELFIIPYFLWFIYMAYGITYLILQERGLEYYRLAGALSFGMTLFIIICIVWPNRIAIRPDTFARDNVFTHMVQYLYSIDTPTNVLPSIHVFNSITVHISLCRTKRYQEHKYLIVLSFIFTTLIVLSTMFLKQHTIIDVLAGMILIGVLYPFIYGKHDKNTIRFWNWFDPRNC